MVEAGLAEVVGDILGPWTVTGKELWDSHMRNCVVLKSKRDML